MAGMDSRVLEDELMDMPGLDADTHIQALTGIGRVNRISGIDSLLWRSLLKFRSPGETRPLRVLDLACGGGDVSIRLARRARQAGIPMEIEGADISQTAVDFARSQAEQFQLDNLQYYQHDALHDPFDVTYDVVMSSLFMHHLSDLQAVHLLRRMSETAQRGILLDDLCRSRLGYVLAWCGVRMLTRSAMVHFDGPVSVKAAFRVDEARQIAAEAGLENITIRRHWPQRFLMTWKRPAIPVVPATHLPCVLPELENEEVRR
ncbi:methyltransferase domain-containing protein [Planctomicrobium sp. SH661]|uniref:methyltransferase domain-containing protein n=1 Tax=Planctomicrobium sp. SH661 TaxID=3448124 RepID=UPI003F5B11F2